MINFGVGKLIAVPTHLADGTAIAVPTPVILGTMQDVSVDMTVETKTLYGSLRYPIAAGQGKGKIEVKGKNADINGGVLGSLFFGKAAAAVIKGAALDLPYSIPGASTYTVTVVAPNSGTFVSDLGVIDATTGVQLVRVASAPTVGQYSVSALGVYTFAAGDASKAVKISFEYSAASGGQLWTISNQVMGYTPAFTLLLQSAYMGKTLVLKLNRCVSGKLALPMKADDYTISDFDAEAFADGAGEMGYICMF